MSLIYPLGPAGSVNLAAPAALALDGSAIGVQFSGTTCTATLTTTTANDIIIAAIEFNTPPIVSLTDVAGLTWNLISAQTRASVYYAKSTGILTGDVITVTIGGADFISMHVFAVKGANFTTPLDANGALPATSGAGPALLSLTTSTPDGFLFGAYRADDNCTAGAGWTTISGANYLLTEYKIVSAIQSGTTVPIGTGSGTQIGGIGHSIRA